jgi:nitroreductase
MSERLDNHALDQLFRSARTRNGWTDRAVPETLIRELYELLRLGPTSANSCPARFLWVRSPEGKQRLSALSSDTNKAKILEAPLTVIVGYDLHFYDRISKWHAPGRVFDSRSQGARARLWTDVGIRQRPGRCGLLCRHPHQVQFHLLDRLRQRQESLSAQSAPEFRGSRQICLIRGYGSARRRIRCT